jgi:hypothetical protein
MSSLALSMTLYTILCICYAGWKGGSPERVVSFLFSLWLLIEPFRESIFPAIWDRLDITSLAVDGFLTLGIVLVALRANRVWPMFAAGFGLVAMLGHFSRAVELDGMQRAYWAMTEPPYVIISLVLVVGTYLHGRRSAVFGSYRDWRSPQSNKMPEA